MDKLTTFDQADLQVLKRELLWQGYFKMVRFTFKHKLFKGGVSPTIERELFERGDAVVVIPYDPVTDRLVLIEQIRVGNFDHDSSPWMIELVAGIIDDGESAEQVAMRETIEETGLEALKCQKILSYLPSPGGMSERIDLYIAQVKADDIVQFAGLEEEGEDIRVFTMSRTEAYQALEQGLINNGASIIGIQWLQLNHQSVRENWI